MSEKDVTTQVAFAMNDEEALPLTQCVCGAKFGMWSEILSIYPDRPWLCPHCGAKLYFKLALRVLQVVEP